jgi:hypothetical protein
VKEKRTLVLPIWHRLRQRQVERYSPTLAAKKGILTKSGIPFVVDQVASVLAGDSIGHGPVVGRRHVLEFFNPKNNLATTIAYNGEFRTPTPKNLESTTEVFVSTVRSALLTLRKIGALRNIRIRPTNYSPAAALKLIEQKTNIVCYASSKINPCTEAILESLNRRYNLGIRFVYMNDAENGKKRSIFLKTRELNESASIFEAESCATEKT